MSLNKRTIQDGFLIFAAVFAFGWAVARACVQSLTIDESHTYLFFVADAVDMIWWPSANNHILNSALIWVSTYLFDVSELTVRAPALLGSILYILVCYFLCRSITNQFVLQLPLFICLTYNPFIFDFMVAARGYSLAMGFLMAAIAIPVWHQVKGGLSIRQSCVAASLALGLSFTANFSFAFVNGAAFLAIVLWAIRRRGEDSILRIIELCVLPGLSLALVVGGYTLAKWQRSEIYFGARSVSEMTRSLADDSLYQLNPRLTGATLYTALNYLKPLLLPLLGILCLYQLAVTRLDRTWFRDQQARRRGKFAAAIASIVALSVLLNWITFHFFHLPLPMGRTGIYLVTLVTLLAGVIAAAIPLSELSRWGQRGIMTVFICLACYFLFCLRLRYFKEWQYDADVKDVYSVLARYNHKYGVRDASVMWLYSDAMNFYRVSSKGGETFMNFANGAPDPVPDKTVYVLEEPSSRQFIDREKLVIVYKGKSTDVVIAVKPGGAVPVDVER